MSKRIARVEPAVTVIVGVDTHKHVHGCLRRSLLIGHLQLCGRDGHDRSRPPYT